MLIKDKDILCGDVIKEQPSKVKKDSIDRKNMKSAWGDAFDYYIRSVTENYLFFRGRATRFEFWGFFVAFGLILLVLYALGCYVDISLALYFAIASLIPAVAVMVRRLHDIDKNPLYYLGCIILLPILAFFIGYWTILFLLLWIVLLIYFFSKETVAESTLYGEAKNEEVLYGADTIRIIRKFRLLSLLCFAVLFIVAYIGFDNWSKQAEYKATNDAIMMEIEQNGRQLGLNDEQIKAAQDVMKQTLKAWDGKEVKPADITKAIKNSVQKEKKNLKSKKK